MRVHRSGERPEDARFPGLTALRMTAAAALVLGTVAFSAGSAAAQADEDEGTYEAPTYGYTLEWDVAEWTVEGEAGAADNNGRDYLNLLAADSSIQLFVEGSEDEWDDPADCVQVLLDEAGQVFGDDLALADDPLDGEALDGGDFELDEDGHARAAYVVDGELDGETVPFAFFAECSADPDGDVIVGFSGAAITGPDFTDDSYPAIEAVVTSLPFAGDSGSDDDSGTPVSEDDEEDASPSADDEDDNGGSGTGGVDGNVYTSPTYGFELEFDDDTWTVEDEASEDDVDTLVLESDLLVATVSGFTQPDDLGGCVDYYVDVLNTRGEDAGVAINSDGEEQIFPEDDDSRIGAFYFYTDDNGDEVFVDFYCYPLGGDDYLSIDFSGPQDNFTDDSDAVGELIEGLLNGVTLP